MKQTRVDTVANLLVDAGNFAPQTTNRADSLKLHVLLDFYRTQKYDALTLSTREVQLGLKPWIQNRDSLPIVVANLFPGNGGPKPLFKPYVIRQDRGRKIGVIGFVSESAWKARRDTTLDATVQPPVAMGKLIRKVAKKTDYLTVLGDFTFGEADSLAAHYPEIDLIVSSGIKSADHPRQIKNTVIIGSATRGNFANYIDFSTDPADTAHFHPFAQTLDESVPVDSSVLKYVTHVNEAMKAKTGQH